jgi:hypothetical protein
MTMNDNDFMPSKPCWTCGKIVPCDRMIKADIVYNGAELYTPAYECADCAPSVDAVVLNQELGSIWQGC